MLRKLEKYELLEEIGHGGMATVFRARDSRLDRLVAVKVLHPHLQKTDEARERFHREAQSVARLRHHNILEIYDYGGDDQGESYIATELLTGPTLKSYVRQHGALPPEVAACMSIQILQALAAAHAKGIVHRDVKPENVLIHEDRCVKLTDFGVAHMVDAQSFTHTGQILGSPGHMAPEQVDGRVCDARTDLFSLGTVLYYLAVGELPFRGRNPHQVLKRIVEGEYLDPLRLRPEIGEPMRRIVVRSLETEPEDRFQNTEEFVRSLAEFVEHAGIDDVDATLERFLREPSAMRSELRARTIASLTSAGERALSENQTHVALEHFNRVLAMDDGNQRVIALLRQVGRRRRIRQIWLPAAFAAAIVCAMGLIGLMTYSGGSAPHPDKLSKSGKTTPPTTVAQNAGLKRVAVMPVDASAASSDADASAGSLESAGSNDSDESTRARAKAHPGHTRRSKSPRLVIFKPRPQNVAIGVNGAPPQDFGPRFRQVELAPGSHRFRFVGGENCCEDLETSVYIPPGTAPFELRRTLKYKPARLIVRSQVAAPTRIEVLRGEEAGAQGASNEIFSVPMGSMEELRRFTVTSPGYKTYTSRIRLRAGHLVQQRIRLERADENQ